MDNNQLYHHGVKGMKWGQRRYQNKDGTLTNAGKKRYNKELEKLKQEQKVLKNKQRTQAKIDKLEKMRKDIDDAKKAMDEPDKPSDGTLTDRRKSARKMSNEELAERIGRLDQEKSYQKVLEDTDRLSKGKRMAVDILEKVGKDLAEQTLEYAVGTLINKTIFKGADAIDPKNIQNRRKK